MHYIEWNADDTEHFDCFESLNISIRQYLLLLNDALIVFL